MVSFRKKQQGSAEIRFSSDRQDKTSFLTNDTIVGTVIYKLPNGVDFDHSKVALKGEFLVENVYKYRLVLMNN